MDAYPQGSCCVDLQHGLSQLSADTEGHKRRPYATHSSAFQSWYHIIRTGEDKTQHLVPHPAHPMPWLFICPVTSPGVRKVEPKNEQVFITQERKNQPTTNSVCSAEKWNFPASQLLNPHVFISFYFGLSSSPFLQDMVKFSHFSSQSLVCCQLPLHTRLWQRREEQLPSTNIHSAKCVRASVLKSFRSLHSWVIFVSVINVTLRGKAPRKHQNSSSAFICEQAPKSFEKSLQQPSVSVNNMIWFIHLVYTG